MSWLRKKRTGGVKRILDEIDLSILVLIQKKGSTTMSDLKRHTKLSWANLQVHKNRLSPLLNIDRQKDNSKVVTLKEDVSSFVDTLVKYYS